MCNPSSGQQAGYSCPLANAEYEQLVSGNPLKLENSGGQGTACGHWEEGSFQTSQSSELMTGFFEPFLLQPLSLVTVAALDDLGAYQVDYCGADVWPATPETQQKFEVFITSQNITMDMVDSIPLGGMMDGDGNIMFMPDSAAAGLQRAFLGPLGHAALAGLLFSVALF